MNVSRSGKNPSYLTIAYDKVKVNLFVANMHGKFYYLGSGEQNSLWVGPYDTEDECITGAYEQ